MENHAHDRGDADQQQDDGGDQRQRRRELAFAVDEAVGNHRFALMTQVQHELHVIDDAADQHQDAQATSVMPKLRGAAGMSERAGLFQLLEELKDRESEADQRQ